jgi:hypothetical protein
VQVRKNIPGDQQVSDPYWFLDDSVVVKCSRAELWPWLVQMGNGRAGWYSYDWLDNLGKKSFDYIDSSLQDVEPGLTIPMFTFEEIEKDRYLTLKVSSNANMTYLLEDHPEGCLLTSRIRVKGPKWLLSMSLGPAHVFMQNKQFKELKKRCE